MKIIVALLVVLALAVVFVLVGRYATTTGGALFTRMPVETWAQGNPTPTGTTTPMPTGTTTSK